MTKKKSEDVVKELAAEETAAALLDAATEMAELAETKPSAILKQAKAMVQSPADRLRAIQHELTEDGSFELGKAAACIGDALEWCQRHEDTEEA